MTGDPFGTAEVRERVLAQWAAAPVRFREDANAEEDLALGGYRDRVIVELAQNAADAASRAGDPGRLLLRLDEIDGRAVLVAANTGAPLDAAGVLALATLRASAKRTVPTAPVPESSGPESSGPESSGAESSGPESSGAELPVPEPAEPEQQPEPEPESESESEPESESGWPGLGLGWPVGPEPAPLTSAAPGSNPTVPMSTAPISTAAVESEAPVEPEAPGEVVGRFGVGFSAVLAVTDEPAIVSRHGGVRFSAAATRDLVQQAAESAPGLAEELGWREGHVPVLRLPFVAEGSPPDGYDTAVLLPLRDAAAQELVVRLLGEVADPLLLALPGLAEVIVELPGRPERRIHGVCERWHVLRRAGRFDPALLAGRPTEERARSSWSLTWALPREPGIPLPGVLQAPTPSDERLPWPAVLIATFPLDSSRRHVAPGPATDTLIRRAALAYAELLAERAAAGADVWDLVPIGLPAGVLDGALRQAVLEVLPSAPILRAALPPEPALTEPDGPEPALTEPDGPEFDRPRGEGSEGLLRPRDAAVLEPPAGADPGVVAALAPLIAGLVRAPRSAGPVVDRLGITRLRLADVIEQLPMPADPSGWRRLYGALAGLAVDPLAREALAGLPVPLADGRVVRGPRGLALPSGAAELAGALARLGARVVHPDAVHPLLEQLGAVPVGPRTALELPAVRAAVLAGGEDDELVPDDALADALVDRPADAAGDDLHGRRARAVLTLVAAAVSAGELPPGELPWLAELVLPEQGGGSAPAGELALPGSLAAEVLDADEIGLVDDALLERWGSAVLAAVGVLAGLAVLRAHDLPLDPDLLDGHGDEDQPADDPRELADWDGWVSWALDEVAERAGRRVQAAEVTITELLAVRDLDAVREPSWPRVLDALGADELLRPAVLAPARLLVRGPHGALAVDVLPYTAWWLRRRLAGGRPWADPQADPVLARVLPGTPPQLRYLDPGLRRALGAVATLDDLDPPATDSLLAGLADESLELDTAAAVQLWSGLARLATHGAEVTPPVRLRVLRGSGTAVVDAAHAVVVDAPALLQRPDLGHPVVVGQPEAAAALADLLDLPLASELAAGQVDESADPGEPAPVPEAVLALLPGAPGQWCEHDRLLVDGVDVDWWVDGAGQVHACTVDGLARGLAWAAGCWHRRAAVCELLTDPSGLAALLADEAFAVPPDVSGSGSGPVTARTTGF